VSSTPAGDLLIIAGEIDDDTVLTSVVDELRTTPIIDLGAVTFINSVGVREWVLLLDQLAQRNLKVTLREVSEPMVRQMTMVMEARGSAAVESFYAPYTCALAKLQPPVLPCRSCGADAVFDDFPARYFSFLFDEKEPA